MNFFYEFILAIRCYSRAIAFIRSNRLWYLLIIPALLNLLVLIFVIYVFWQYSGTLIDYCLTELGIQLEGGWLMAIQFLIAFVIRVIVLMLYMKLFRYIVLIFYAPMLAFISDKVQDIITNNPKPFNVVQFTKDIYRGMTIAIRNLVLELAVTLLILVVSFALPFLAILAPILIFIVESYFYGFAMIDYRNEYYMISANESRRIINLHRGLAIGNGMLFNMMLLIPFIGVMIAPVLAVVAGGLAINEVEND